ncbi:MAG: amino acid--tRNA ligase-related protein [Phycisphaerae bacterium]
MNKYYDTKICRLAQKAGEQVKLAGWVQKCQPRGKVIFLTLRDGSGYCQCVVEKGNVSEQLFDEIKRLGQESSLTITGLVRADERSEGGVEVVVGGAEIFCNSAEYPIANKEHGVDFLLKNRHLHLRSRRQWCINRVRHTVIRAIRDFFNENEFTLIDTPIFTTAAGEGEQTLFEVDYFGEPLHLSQTGQLYLESAALSHGKVYCFGPTFRAEKSKTRRHLTEFWMVEPEVAFADLDELLELAENFVSHIASQVLAVNRAELDFLGSDISVLERIKPPFYRITYSEAVEMLRGEKTREFMQKLYSELSDALAAVDEQIAEAENTLASASKSWQKSAAAARLQSLSAEKAELETQIENNPKHLALAQSFEWGKDLGGSDETIISLMHDKPVFVTHYPKEVKAFYMKQDRGNEAVVENFDLLASGGFGEIIGGSVREHDHDMLLSKIEAEGYNPESYSWYLDLRKFGSVPHGGFGLGLERTVAWLTGERHIRQCIAFPRMMHKVHI